MRGKSLFILMAALVPLLVVEGFCGYQVHVLSARQENVKEDYSKVNNITFGLLSVSEWMDKIAYVVNRRVRHFRLTPEQKKEVKAEIEQLLYSLEAKTLAMIERPKKSLKGKVKKLAFNTFVDKDKLRSMVPVFADRITEEIERPSTRKRLSRLVSSKIAQLEKGTYDSSREVERGVIDSILQRYRVNDIAGFDRVTAAQLSTLRHDTYGYAFGLLGCILVFLALWWFLRKKHRLHTALYALSILSAIILLLVGLTTTMIEVDARIRAMHFHLLGETISFKDQVLFFQSKSIVDVVVLLIKTGRYDSVIVGLLILCFSIVFPLAKMCSAGFYLLGKRKWSKGSVVQFFAFKSSKWSMADVMVVAILMTYIGFNGILDSQMAGLNVNTATLSSITTNNTALQPGYIVFLGFVIYGFILSHVLRHLTTRQPAAEEAVREKGIRDDGEEGSEEA
jgi:hypothetical protein